MKYISVIIRPAKVFHGYSDDNKLIAEEMHREDFVEKVLSIDRILSVTEDHLFVQCPHGRIQNWEYKGSIEDIKTRFRTAGILID